MIVLSATAGGMIFDEFSSLPPLNIVLFWAGNAVTMVGLFVLAVFQAKRAKELEIDESKSKETRTYPTAVDVEGGAVVGETPSTASASAETAPTAPEGYVRDPTCYFCGCRLPCFKQPW